MVATGHLAAGSVRSCGCLLRDHLVSLNKSRRVDLIGRRFGRLSVIRNVRWGNKARWECLCDCGAKTLVYGTSLAEGKTTSCGCAQRDAVTTHGHYRGNIKSPTMMSWQSMLSRCANPLHSNFRYYGGRGITVCERWHDFAAFLEDMGERPDGYVLDRIDNDLGYEPSNCRWITAGESVNHKRNSVVLEHNGERLTIAQWARKAGVTWSTVKSRIERGWSVGNAVSLPAQRSRGRCTQ